MYRHTHISSCRPRGPLGSDVVCRKRHELSNLSRRAEYSFQFNFISHSGLILSFSLRDPSASALRWRGHPWISKCRPWPSSLYVNEAVTNRKVNFQICLDATEAFPFRSTTCIGVVQLAVSSSALTKFFQRHGFKGARYDAA